MRQVKHPGPVAKERLALRSSRGRAIQLTLQAGQDLETAIVKATKTAGVRSAWLTFDKVAVDQLAYVIPDKAPNDQTVAWYSETHRFNAPGHIDHLGLIVGQFEQAPFLHGHGLWTEAGHTQTMGHILSQETYLSEDIKVSGIALEGALFDRRFDPESNFSLFQPVRDQDGMSGDFALLRILPNEDLATALDDACIQLGWDQAKAYGLGSLVETRFETGSKLDSFATEFLILDADGRADHAPRPGPDIAIVGEAGGRGMRGRITRGDNPVLVTAEIFLQKVAS